MDFLLALWLPILLSGIALFFTSSLFWTVLPHHEGDHDKAPNEEDLMKALGQLDLPAGPYLFPFVRHSEHNDESKQALYQAGPRGQLILWDLPNMGRNLLLTLTYFLVVSLVAGYIAYEALEGSPNLRFLKVFQVVGALGALVFCSSGQLNAIWFPRRKLMDLVDGVVYGIIMGLIFASLWPMPSV